MIQCYLKLLRFSLSSSSFRRRQWHPTLELLPGKSHGWRSLVGCRLWGRTESDTTEVTQQQQQQTVKEWIVNQSSSAEISVLQAALCGFHSTDTTGIQSYDQTSSRQGKCRVSKIHPRRAINITFQEKKLRSFSKLFSVL